MTQKISDIELSEENERSKILTPQNSLTRSEEISRSIFSTTVQTKEIVNTSWLIHELVALVINDWK